MNTFWQDIRFAFRMMMKNKSVTLFSVLTLALGIGACTAVFSLVNGVLLASLPVPNPHELRVVEWSGGNARFMVTGRVTDVNTPGTFEGDSMSYPVFETLREQCAEQADVFGFADLREIAVRVRQESFPAEGLMVSDNFFSALGVKPLLGQSFKPGTTFVDDAYSVIITYPWWEQKFGLDTNALGQTITLKGHPYTVIGVLPPGFPGVHPGDNREFYVSMEAQPQLMSDWPRTAKDRWWIRLMARKKSGIDDAQFQAAFDVAFANAAADQLTSPKMRISDGKAGPVYQSNYYKRSLLLLLGVVCMVVLIACANLAGLSLARGAARQHEFSVRAAIGAGRWRLIRQTLTESTVLCLLGGGLGVVFALWGKGVIGGLLTGSPNGLHYDTSLDLRVLGFTLTITILTALLSGLLPAIKAAFADPLSGLKTRSVLGMLRLRPGRFLVTVQVALSLFLLTGAGLYVRTIVNLVRIDPGFGMDNLLLLQVNPNRAGYEGEETRNYYDRARASLAALPGVQSAAISQFALLNGWMSGGGFFTIPNHPSDDGSRPNAHRLTVSEAFFSTMGIPILMGREFSSTDTENAVKIVVVNETFAKQYMPGDYPIGQIIRIGETDWRIAGVCADVKYTDIKGDVPPTMYFSFRQDSIGSAFFAIRTSLPPLSIVKAVRQTMSKIDPNIPIIDVMTQNQIRDRKIAHEWMLAILCGSLSLLAVLLSCIGLYGLMTFNVTQRTNEIGVRMALGATRFHVAWPILREALSMSAIGALIGGAGAFALTRFIRSQLYGVEPDDPVTFAFAVIVLLAVALLAAWLPARRAAKVDPMVALRYE